VIKDLLVEIKRLPRWPSVSADPTIVPRLLIISNLLQDEVVQFNYVGVLIVESVKILADNSSI
jgi:hypothetical protein